MADARARRNGDAGRRVLVFYMPYMRSGRTSCPGTQTTTRGPAMRINSWRMALAAAAAVTLPLALPAEVGAQEDVRGILARADSVYDELTSLEAEFDQTIDVTLLGRSRSGTGTWYQKGPGRFKMDFSDPADDVIVADGSHLWLYYPSTHPNQVIRSTIDANVTGAGMVDLQGRIFDEASEGYDAELEGREDVDGHETLRIHLTPRGESPYRHVRVWVDAESYLVRKFEIMERNETLRTVVLRDLRPNRPITDEIFSFTPPAGVDVFEG
ncbi:MAG TPA: outer membrane lipoprotein carrier protein LolA [Gemmatimonadota bacterium]|nr:outer membrane lipoprotein carrier protein LolA [Gemmatimonadota bacterium]